MLIAFPLTLNANNDDDKVSLDAAADELSENQAMDDEKRQDDWANSRQNRLPSFTEVLSRRTRPPVDLFMF